MNERRRGFLRVSGMVTAAAAAAIWGPGPAWAQRIRVLDGGGGGSDRLIAVGQSSAELRRLLAGIRIGPFKTHAGMTVFWLSGADTPPTLDVMTLDDARAQNALVIAERAQATVPELTVDNRGKSHILLLAGEILVGGKQNRVLKEDVLLPPHSGARDLGVYCVEQGRWNVGRKDFESKSTFAGAGLRSHLMAKSDQRQVWAEVARRAQIAQSNSLTQSYQEIYEKPEVQQHLSDVERGIEATPPAGTSGAAVFAGGTLAGLDLFTHGTLFGREWPKLLRSYAIDAYRVPQPQAPGDPAKARETLRALLDAAARAEGTVRGNAGVGQIFEFAVGSSRGAALTFEGQVVHTAVL